MESACRLLVIPIRAVDSNGNDCGGLNPINYSKQVGATTNG